MADTYLKAKEVARLVGCSDKTVKRWHKRGLLPGKKPGGATSPIRFSEKAVKRLMKAEAVG